MTVSRGQYVGTPGSAYSGLSESMNSLAASIGNRRKERLLIEESRRADRLGFLAEQLAPYVADGNWANAFNSAPQLAIEYANMMGVRPEALMSVQLTPDQQLTMMHQIQAREMLRGGGGPGAPTAQAGGGVPGQTANLTQAAVASPTGQVSAGTTGQPAIPSVPPIPSGGGGDPEDDQDTGREETQTEDPLFTWRNGPTPLVTPRPGTRNDAYILQGQQLRDERLAPVSGGEVDPRAQGIRDAAYALQEQQVQTGPTPSLNVSPYLQFRTERDPVLPPPHNPALYKMEAKEAARQAAEQAARRAARNETAITPEQAMAFDYTGTQPASGDAPPAERRPSVYGGQLGQGNWLRNFTRSPEREAQEQAEHAAQEQAAHEAARVEHAREQAYAKYAYEQRVSAALARERSARDPLLPLPAEVARNRTGSLTALEVTRLPFDVSTAPQPYGPQPAPPGTAPAAPSPEFDPASDRSQFLLNIAGAERAPTRQDILTRTTPIPPDVPRGPGPTGPDGGGFPSRPIQQTGRVESLQSRGKGGPATSKDRPRGERSLEPFSRITYLERSDDPTTPVQEGQIALGDNNVALAAVVASPTIPRQLIDGDQRKLTALRENLRGLGQSIRDRRERVRASRGPESAELNSEQAREFVRTSLQTLGQATVLNGVNYDNLTQTTQEIATLYEEQPQLLAALFPADMARRQAVATGLAGVEKTRAETAIQREQAKHLERVNNTLEAALFGDSALGTITREQLNNIANSYVEELSSTTVANDQTRAQTALIRQQARLSTIQATVAEEMANAGPDGELNLHLLLDIIKHMNETPGGEAVITPALGLLMQAMSNGQLAIKRNTWFDRLFEGMYTVQPAGGASAPAMSPQARGVFNNIFNPPPPQPTGR